MWRNKGTSRRSRQSINSNLGDGGERNNSSHHAKKKRKKKREKENFFPESFGTPEQQNFNKAILIATKSKTYSSSQVLLLFKMGC